MVQKIAEYIATHPQQLAEQIAAHIGISLVALLVAALIGIPCGCLAARLEKGESIVTAPFEMLRVVPSLAVLILLIPIMGTGVPPAVTALTILAIPPVLLNTIVGFRTIPDFMIESARGIGMTDRELFWRVKIPCALPMILAGTGGSGCEHNARGKDRRRRPGGDHLHRTGPLQDGSACVGRRTGRNTVARVRMGV